MPTDLITVGSADPHMAASPLSRRLCNRRNQSRRAALLFGVVLALAMEASPVFADGKRGSFPGRRIGGATRGECTARLIAHLVPDDNVYAPGASQMLGILEGPTSNPRQVLVAFRAEGAPAGSAPASSLTLPALGPGITLFRRPAVQGATVWESSYRCESTAADPAAVDPLAFISTQAPPALSLLVGTTNPQDAKIQKSLLSLQRSCGGTVSRAEVASSFGLADVLNSDWPERLPVNCPG
jgi:hypothetical protein